MYGVHKSDLHPNPPRADESTRTHTFRLNPVPDMASLEFGDMMVG